ncbi:Hypothetical protein, putative [Bodo saltans]|uniref:Uncharacterized protein n=1 Tax=Bodo saltans TaxID=75058 RepID=A0A0S4IS12_BODSA|nr:Hypothetical protein, putative [Bodo saltans]|eukprot:CUF58066.1 Hypothetical protein, putative [Bodo saltans]
MKKSTSKHHTKRPSSVANGGGATLDESLLPQTASTINKDDNHIRRDGANREDLFLHTAADMIHRIVAAYCNLYDTPYITKYLLGLLLEALVPTAPSFAKDQAHNQLVMLSGSAGLREAVELVKFVQAAGRVTNETLVSNGKRELDRITIERRVRFASDDEVARARLVREDDDDEDGDNDDDIAYISSTRGSVDLRVVPAASIHTELQSKCAAQEKRLADQEDRIRELEATLAEHRPVFSAVQQNAAFQEKPDVILKKAVKKGTVVKKGKSSVSFIDGVEDSAAAMTTVVATSATTATTTLASVGVPQQQQQPRVVRYDSTKEEVIAAARALAMEARSNNMQSSHHSPSSTFLPPQSSTTSSFRQQPAGLSTTGSPPPAFTASHPFATPYMHDLSEYRLGEVPPSFNAASPVPPKVSSQPHYALLADVPLHTSSYRPSPPPQQYSPALTTSPWAAPSTALDVLPLSSKLLSAEDVVRLVSDKRPLSAQASQSFSAWYHLEQEQRAKLLLDLGESSLVSTIQQNAQLASRLAGATHSLALERRYSSANRPPSSLEFINFANNTASPLSRFSADAAARRHQMHVQQQQQQFFVDPSPHKAQLQAPPQQRTSAAAVGDGGGALWNSALQGGSSSSLFGVQQTSPYNGVSSYVTAAARLPSRTQMLNADGSSVRVATNDSGTGDISDVMHSAWR